MKKYILISIATCLAVSLGSCGEKLSDDYEYQAIKPELKISNTSMTIDANRQTVKLSITSNSYWSATTNSNWIYLENSKGKGNGSINVIVYANPSVSEERNGVINVTDGINGYIVQVTQDKAKEPSVSDLSVSDITKTTAECKFTFNSSDLSVTRSGICYSSSEKNPTTNNQNIYYSIFSYNGATSFDLTGLTHNTTYYVRPYVVTSAGTTYGNTTSFTTLKANSPDEGDNPTPNY